MEAQTIFEKGRTTFTECLVATVTTNGQRHTLTLNARAGFDRLDAIYCNYVQLAAGEENIMKGKLIDLKIENTSILFDEECDLNDILAVLPSVPHHERGFPTGGIKVSTSQEIKIVTDDTTPADNFSEYTRKFYLVFSRPNND